MNKCLSMSMSMCACAHVHVCAPTAVRCLGRSSQVHRDLLDDSTARWAMAYRHVYWFLIQPTGPSPRAGPNLGIEVLGDPEAVQVRTVSQSVSQSVRQSFPNSRLP